MKLKNFLPRTVTKASISFSLITSPIQSREYMMLVNLTDSPQATFAYKMDELHFSDDIKLIRDLLL